MDLRLRIGPTVVAAADREAVSAAIAATNARAREAGLPDALNPDVIAPSKAEALLNALMRTPGETLAAVEGRILEFNPMALRIGMSSPSTVASFASPVTLEITSDHGEMVSARAVGPVDCELARERAKEARLQTEQADREYQAAVGDAIMAARRRRYALTRVWFDNAAALAVCVPNDAAAAAERDAAERAMNASVVIGGSMQ
jgi:hypothetical protein